MFQTLKVPIPWWVLVYFQMYLMKCDPGGRIDALLLDFHRTHPDTSVSLIETMDVTGQVLSGGIDIGITIRPDPDQRLVEIPLFEETFSLAVHADSLYAHKKSLYFKDVQKMKMVMFPSYHQCR